MTRNAITIEIGLTVGVPRLSPGYGRRTIRTFMFSSVAVCCFSYSGCRSAEQILFSEGESQLRTHAYEDAYATFSRYIGLHPESSTGFYNRTLAGLGLNRFDEAQEDIEQAILLDPDDIDARWLRFKIRAYCRERIMTASMVASLERPMQQTLIFALATLMLEDLSTILTLDPMDLSARYERGMLFQSLGRITEARTDFDSALLNSPWDIWIRNERGRLMHGLGEYDAAIADYDVGIGSCDTCMWLLYNKALSLKAGGQLQEAAEVLNTLVAIDSLDGEAWLMLGELDFLLGRQAGGCLALARSAELGVVEGRERFQELCR